MTAEGGGMTPKEWPKESEPASEILAQAEQLMNLREIWGCGSDGVSYTHWELNQNDMAAVRRLLSEARVRVAAAEQDTRRLLAATEELRAGDGAYYVTQEMAFAPGIADGWPAVIPAPHTKNGRLVKRQFPGAALSGLDRETTQGEVQ